jgi:hypothetical protein
MQPILGCDNKIATNKKGNATNFLVARLNIATITLVA